jgi:ergothioneine biosynthesis protein EgtB
MAPNVAAPSREPLVAGFPEALDFASVRHGTEKLCEPLKIEDYGLQSMPEASPVKWHLAHTTWFFETFVLKTYLPDYRTFHPQFSFLFNSYYNAVGPRWPRPERGLLSRPTVEEIYQYRAYVDSHMVEFLKSARADIPEGAAAVVILGLNHEQQHQELMLTDLKHALSRNPLRPTYRDIPSQHGEATACDWVAFPEGLVWIGHEGRGFAFDNESPRHRVFVNGFRLASRPATNEEFLCFLDDGGYDQPRLWLSDGWAARQEHGWSAPLYWERRDDEWWVMTLAGPRPLVPAEPVCHVNFYEADAFARWAGARLPTEAEWETAARPVNGGHFLEGGRFHPSSTPAEDDSGPVFALVGDVWQWTASPYAPYPGYEAAPGALGEYNGKFMCNQMVLRGASCATPRSHARRTYRNFFPPDARWQFAGVRLAQDLP